jgi:hypothetical protein
LDFDDLRDVPPRSIYEAMFAHAFGYPVAVKTFYDDLIATGLDVGVSMPVMESHAEDIGRFASTAYKNETAGSPMFHA